ncbi:MAG TPA: hypothetical protein VK750_01120 [Cytophagaceae bacterium]|jgi:hypothetical protein|nr:hypothetical protein [Cytophagaceae bacterium]
MKKIFFLLLLTSSYGKAQDTPVPLPQNYEIIDQTEGDLDRDGIAELAIILNTTDSSENGLVREIRIFKSSGETHKWILWKKSTDVLMASDEGGMMGDPYQETTIKNNVLTIHHSGSSSWKWDNTDRYRFQNNEFELIGYTTEYGKPCEYFTSFDFNLSTGKIVYEKNYETCDEDGNETTSKTETETFVKKGIKLNFNNRRNTEIKIVAPKYNEEFYL